MRSLADTREKLLSYLKLFACYGNCSLKDLRVRCVLWPRIWSILNQALSLWSGSTDSKTLDYQRTNTSEYPIVRTHTKETTSIQDQASPNQDLHITLCRTPHLNNKQNKNTNPITSRQDYHLTQSCPSEEKQTNKNSAQVSPYRKLTQTAEPTLGGQKPKGRKNSTLKPRKRRPQT